MSDANVADPTAACPRTMWRGDQWSGKYESCGKPAKRDGLCGVHANAADRSEAASQRWTGRRADARVKADATDRVRAFLDGWATLGDKDDVIYGIFVKNGDQARVLLASDLRLVVGGSSPADGAA